MLPPVRLYRTHPLDRVAVVSVEPAFARPGAWLIRVARGVSADRLTGGTTFGPVAEAELPSQFDAVVESLQAEGFAERTVEDWAALLNADDSRTRARAALRLGWQRNREAVELLLARLDTAVDDLCSIVDALGAIGDPRAMVAIRPIADRKLLSRRRSAVEALRNLGDDEGLAAVLHRSREALPDSVRQALDGNAAPESSQGFSEIPGNWMAELLKNDVEPKRLAWALDNLYELDDPAGNAAVRAVLGEIAFGQAFTWRYVKSIFTRSMLRHDAVTFGRLAHRIEQQARTTSGEVAVVKSGYDGVERETRIFGRKTQRYVRRLSWRYLRQLARYRPEVYTQTATEVLIHYSADDQREPTQRLGRFADCYLLNRILFGRSSRLELDDRRLRYRTINPAADASPKEREESYPHLWDRHPRPFLRLLSSAVLTVVQEFARFGLERHPDLLATATPAELIAMLDSIHEETVQLALNEIRERFDPHAPDWELLDRCVRDERETVLEFARRCVAETAALWTANPQRTVAWLQCRDPELRELVIARSITALKADPDLRRRFAGIALPLFRNPQADNLDALARVARECLTDEFATLLTSNELLEMTLLASPPVQAVAGEVLCSRGESLRMEQVLALATHEIATVRAAAQRLLARIGERLRLEPDVLFALVESDWPDTRQVAFELLERHVDWSQAGTERLLGLLDSNQPDVQDFGRQLVEQRGPALDPATLAWRLAEHPHANMRKFAMELVERHIPDGAESLERLEQFFRVVLLELSPDRRTRERLIRFLERRGLRDEPQARVAVRFLRMMLRVQSRAGFEPALQALARLKLAWPELEMPLELV